MDFPEFPCDRCGLCCEHLADRPLYADLNDGTGVCRYFDQERRLCSIYEQRPQKCNVNAGYVWFQDQMSYEAYRELNIAGCKKLKEEYLCHFHL